MGIVSFLLLALALPTSYSKQSDMILKDNDYGRIVSDSKSNNTPIIQNHYVRETSVQYLSNVHAIITMFERRPFSYEITDDKISEICRNHTNLYIQNIKKPIAFYFI